jgi:MFS family permease
LREGNTFFPTLVFTLAPETMPVVQLAGLALALVAVGSGLGVLTGPPVLGSLIGRDNWTAGSIWLLVIMGCGAIASLWRGGNRDERETWRGS